MEIGWIIAGGFGGLCLWLLVRSIRTQDQEISGGDLWRQIDDRMRELEERERQIDADIDEIEKILGYDPGTRTDLSYRDKTQRALDFS